MRNAVKRFVRIAIVSLALSIAGTAHAQATDPCPVGETRAVNTGDARLLTTPFVTGCADLRHLGRMELIAYRQRYAGRNELCVEMQTRSGASASCRDPADDIHGLDHGLTTVHSRRWLLIEGFASLRVVRVRLRYRSRDERRRTRGVITRVTDPALLSRLQLTAPFAHFLAEVSRHGRTVALYARNGAGKLVFWRSLPDVRDFFEMEGGEVVGTLP